MPERIHLNSISTVLFDMDGTLVDHFDTIFRCYQHAAKAMGVDAPSYSEVKRAVGGSMPVTIRSFFTEDNVEEAMSHWNKRFEEIHLQGVKVLKGARELIEILRNRGLKLGVFTNKSGRHTRNIIESMGLSDTFSLVLGANDTPYRKPQEEIARHALEALNSKPEETLLIGDSPFDIASANSVGMACWCVATGSHSRSELLEAKADAVFDDLKAIKVSLSD